MGTKVVEKCDISPSGGGAAEQSLPLIYLDVPWLLTHHMRTLNFYSFPCSKHHFFNTILPNLKNSLSLALKHFLPLAGKIIFPLNSGMPVSRYASGEDSVSLTVSVSDSDFFLLTGNHPKDADVFYNFIPEIPPALHSSDSITFPVLALQITLFPNQGICNGVANHHAIADGAVIICFLQTWASINKFHDDRHLLALGHKALPVYDRTAVEDSGRLTPRIWEMLKNSKPTVSSTVSFPTHKLRETFFLSDQEIAKLKKLVRLKKPGLAHVSSFTVTCARVWSCIAGSAAAAGEAVGDDELEYFSMPVDCRSRLRPPLPSTYFGNCLVVVLAECAHGRLKGSSGLVAAAEAIGEAIDKSLSNKKGILDGSIEGYLKYKEVKRVVGVSGSPRFDMCGIDYGWGGMKKAEALHIDVSGSISIFKTRDGVEVGLSMPKLNMDAFASFFNINMHHTLSNL